MYPRLGNNIKGERSSRSGMDKNMKRCKGEIENKIFYEGNQSGAMREREAGTER